MRFALALSVSLITGTASANSMAIPPGQHGIFDSGKLPPSAQGIMTFGEAGSISLKAVPYSALPLSAPIGTAFFCTDCAGQGQPVFFNGTIWVDASGAGVKHS